MERAEGGMGMVNIENFIMSKHIKTIYKIIQSETESWNAIGKHWLQTLDRKYAQELFIARCTDTKCLTGENIDYPEIYQKMTKCWSQFMKKLEVNTKSNILKQNIFGNTNIQFRGNSILIKS